MNTMLPKTGTASIIRKAVYEILSFSSQACSYSWFYYGGRVKVTVLKLSVHQADQPATWIHVVSRHESKRGQTVLAAFLPHG